MKKFLGRIFRIKEWSDWDRGKSSLLYVKELFKKLFTVAEFDPELNKFDTVAKRYHLTEEKIKQQSQIFKSLSLIFFVIACVIIGVFCYYLYHGHFLASIVTLCISMIAWVLSFRFHFYLTLIRHKRLDCTIRDWFELNFKK
jgi:intracellular multiplication protein IcmV